MSVTWERGDPASPNQRRNDTVVFRYVGCLVERNWVIFVSKVFLQKNKDTYILSDGKKDFNYLLK